MIPISYTVGGAFETASGAGTSNRQTSHRSHAMDAWKKLICRGNRSFERGLMDEAARLYLDALQEADRCIGCVAVECAAMEACQRQHRMDGFPAAAIAGDTPADVGRDLQAASQRRYLDAVAAVASYVVTRLNLADLCLKVDRGEEAAEHLQAMQARLQAIIDDLGQPWTLRAAALRNTRRAQDAVLSFVAEHGIAGPSCAFERPITHLPPSPALH
jgi:hypothetical protein